MVSRTLGAVIVLLATGVPTHAQEAGDRVTLDELIARSLRSSRAEMARAETSAARARADRATAARLPTIAALGYLGPSPEIECLDPGCTMTDPRDFQLRLSGVATGATITVTQPVYTFGKLTSIREAARAGVVAQDALEDALAGELAIEAARAYWGLKLARELELMLVDGIAEIEEARARVEERLAEATGEATIQDRLRIDVLLAEVRTQLADVRGAAAEALAGVRAIAGPGNDAIDIDEAPLAPVELDVPTEAELIDTAIRARPEVRAADAGARAAERLVAYETSQYWPDLAIAAELGASWAQGVDDAPGAIYDERFNETTAALGVVVRWNVEPWTTRARVAEARADRRRADARAELARTGAALDARTAWAEAARALAKREAAEAGETSARAWLASVLQADAVGTAETRDLTDAYVGWFQLRARHAEAIFAWNVAAARVARARGDITAADGR